MAMLQPNAGNVGNILPGRVVTPVKQEVPEKEIPSLQVNGTPFLLWTYDQGSSFCLIIREPSSEVNIIPRFEEDGIHLDWETPGGPPPEIAAVLRIPEPDWYRAKMDKKVKGSFFVPSPRRIETHSDLIQKHRFPADPNQPRLYRLVACPWAGETKHFNWDD